MGERTYQVCTIEHEGRDGGKTGILGKPKCLNRYVAKSSGQIIAYTEEVEIAPFDVSNQGRHKNEEAIESLQQAYSIMLQRLLNDGWEPMGSDELGKVTQLKRKVGVTETTATNTPSGVELLQQLTSLRDAGILTEEEFQTKKAEILKRI